ncbi:hypothetical protein K466DRAFT_505052 [Polyporus arcularius HHB13444]|uniref:Integrase core domain-containing protein n=2 Tax=Polyporaceae TaxID=5317 RepID=A0A5C3NUT7_9APHY|nr:hypothetical protein OH76DRAFT_1361552 [Polyporus brumalis]TFK79760.1 hypothetical protein K466DRAFT_505052 [Polyporus arcularius HHB13444]
MEEVRGSGRGSYIWGRSVHNIRIERLWVDVTCGFGHKWKEFFRLLEVSYDLNVDRDADIWLLHHLFLEAINRDAEQWAAAWNQHTIARRGERHLSPTQMYVRGTAVHGRRGVYPEDVTREADPASDEHYADYGIDWDDIERQRIRDHHDRYNQDDGDATNPFLTDRPGHLSHIEVPDSQCPFGVGQVRDLDMYLAQLPCYARATMESCLELWIAAKHFVLQL